MIRSPRTLILALLAAAIATPAAIAQPLVTVQSVTVTFGDLDLSKPAGIASLMSRIDWAARHACGNLPFATEQYARTQYRACVDAAVTHGVADVGNPELTALFNSRDITVRQFARR